MNSKQIGTVVSTLGTLATAIGEVVRRYLRKTGQEKLQRQVNETAPVHVKKEDTMSNEYLQITLLHDNKFDFIQYKEVSISDNEATEWKSFISTLGGETTKVSLTVSAFNGLLKCDVPLKDLCKVKGNPEAMRGIIIQDGKISKQASFSEAGIGNAAPLLIFQFMATITSQYYQQIITEKLDALNVKLDSIIATLAADDRAKLKVAYNRFIELSGKNTYDIADKQIVEEFSGYVERIREKYRILLSETRPLDVGYKWTDKGEAELKVLKLQESHFFDNLEMAMQAESLMFVASAVSVKISSYLGNEEDIKKYANRMNLDYWNNYVEQFYKIKHDVIQYLELEAKSSWMQRKTIMSLRDEQLAKFNSVESKMLELQNQFECIITQYIKVQEDGTLKKYISFSKV